MDYYSRIKIEINSFKNKDIEQATRLLTSADLSNYKNKNSLFYKNSDNEFININSDSYGLKSAAIIQFVLSIAFKQAKKNNSSFQVQYKTIQEHLANLKCSINHISETINNILVKNNILTRKRYGRNIWRMQLTDEGYESLFGFKIGENKNYLKHKSPRIYKWLENKLRAFRKFFNNSKKRSLLELIKKVLLNIKLYTKKETNNLVSLTDNDVISNDPPYSVKTNLGDVGINSIFSDEDIESIFGSNEDIENMFD